MVKKKGLLALLLSTLFVLPYNSTVVKAATADELYTNAYNAVTECQKLKTQSSINAAREAIKRLKNTSAAFAIGEFSKLVDPIQQGLFEQFMGTIFTNGVPKVYEEVSQESINLARDLVNSFATCEDNRAYVKSWSSKLDEYQNYYIKAAVELFETAKKTGDTKDIENARVAVEGLLSARNNKDVYDFAANLINELNLMGNPEAIGPELIEGIKFNTEISDASEDGTYVMATFKNNSKYTIVGFEAVAKLKDINGISNMEYMETVLPNETSAIFGGQGPDSGKASDMEVETYKITISDKAGNQTCVDYNLQTKTYKYTYMESEATSSPILKVEQLPVKFEFSGPEELGVMLLNATYTNNSNYKIKGCSYILLNKLTNLIVSLDSEDEVLPGKQSPLFTTMGPEDGNLSSFEILEYDITVENEYGEEVHVHYDAKLKLYTQD